MHFLPIHLRQPAIGHAETHQDTIAEDIIFSCIYRNFSQKRKISQKNTIFANSKIYCRQMAYECSENYI